MIKIDIDRIFQIAVEIEEMGIEFYEKASDLVEGDARKVFLALAKMEANHSRTFEKMRKALTETQEYLAEFDPDDGVGLYLQFSVESTEFRKLPDDIFSGEESSRDLVRFALEREKDSVVFFKTMKDAVMTEQERGEIEKIINEEIDHTLKLTRLLVEMK